MRRSRILATARRTWELLTVIGTAATAITLGAGCGQSVPDSGEHLATSIAAVVNGYTPTSNPYGVVAVYHQYWDYCRNGFYWYPRTCSGYVLNASATEKVVVTARHCVVQNVTPGLPCPGGLASMSISAEFNAVGFSEDFSSALLDPSQVYVSADLNPGPPIDAQPVPAQTMPSNAVPVNWIYGYQYGQVDPSTDGYQHPVNAPDVAVLGVVNNAIPGSSTPPNPVGLYLGSAEDFVSSNGQPMAASGYQQWGYGETVLQHSLSSNTSSGQLHFIVAPSPTDISGLEGPSTLGQGDYANYNDGLYGSANLLPVGAGPGGGDCGGPVLALNGNYATYVGMQGPGIGVSRMSVNWLQPFLDGLVIRSLSSLPGLASQGVTWTSLAASSVLTIAGSTSSNSYGQRWSYDWLKHTIETPGNGMCLSYVAASPSNPPLPVLAACNANDSAQNWIITARYQVKNPSSGLCLQACNSCAGYALIANTCDDNNGDQRWTWDPDPRLTVAPRVFWGQNHGIQWSPFTPPSQDWKPGSYKGQCPWISGDRSNESRGSGEPLTGMSAYTSSAHQAHAVRCDYAARFVNSGPCRVQTFPGGGADFQSASCLSNEYVQGVSQTTNGIIDALLCCPGQIQGVNLETTNCTAQDFYAQNSPGFAGTDWDPGYYKGQCSGTGYVRAVMTYTGKPYSLICCSPQTRVAIKTYDGHYVTANSDGGSAVSTTATWVLPWELFGIYDVTSPNLMSGDSVNIGHVADSGTLWFATADVNGGGAGSLFRVNRTAPASWETFTISKVGGSNGPIRDGDHVTFRSQSGWYVSAINGGGLSGDGSITVDRTQPLTWETFTVEFQY